jgi:hypothetical protein
MGELRSSSSWKLEGDYFEGCNCDIVCPYLIYLKKLAEVVNIIKVYTRNKLE